MAPTGIDIGFLFILFVGILGAIYRFRVRRHHKQTPVKTPQIDTFWEAKR